MDIKSVGRYANLSSISEFKTTLLKQISVEFDPLTDLLDLLNQQLKEVPSLKLTEGGYIADGVSEELDQLRDISRNSKEYLNQMLQHEREITGITSLKISYNKVFGYFLEVSNAHKSSVPENYIRKQTLVNAERYITADLKEFEEKILSAEERIGVLEYELFQQLKVDLNFNTLRVQKTAQDIAVADTLAGLAHVAEHNHYTRPSLGSLDTPRKMFLSESRHPVIERIALDEEFVPNDLDLQDTKCRIMLITGPNMAGKSTYMRQVALNILMAQCGCFVAASKSELSVMDRIFTRVGASDNLTLGQSTFMLEMNEAASILNNATDRSLIILDEIGRGTSTFDGISIAWSIVEFLHGKEPEGGPKTLFATHYHELTDLSRVLSGVMNFNIQVKEWNDEIIFLRKIIPGGADKSYRIQVARLAGLPKKVLDRANEVLFNLEQSEFDEIGIPKISRSENKNSLDSKGQLNLFRAPETPLIKKIRQIDPNDMSPKQALDTLFELSKILKENSK